MMTSQKNKTASAMRHVVTLMCAALLAVAAAPAQSDQIIYMDSLLNGWQNWGWATLNYANAVPTHSGSASISIDADAWEAVYLGHAAFDTTPYASLSFWIHGGSTAGQHLQVQG